MKRKKIKIDKYIISHLVKRPRDEEKVQIDENEFNKYEFIEQKITGTDEYDGGADYTLIIRRKSDDKFFELNYTEWDIDWEKSPDFDSMPEEFTEVFPEVITITVYK